MKSLDMFQDRPVWKRNSPVCGPFQLLVGCQRSTELKSEVMAQCPLGKSSDTPKWIQMKLQDDHEGLLAHVGWWTLPLYFVSSYFRCALAAKLPARKFHRGFLVAWRTPGRVPQPPAWWLRWWWSAIWRGAGTSWRTWSSKACLRTT